MNKPFSASKTAAAVTLITLGVAAGIAYVTSGDVAGQVKGETAPAPDPGRVICIGCVEAVDGQVDVTAQLSGQLAEVRVTEGDSVEAGDVLAVIDARREAAAVALAEAEVARAQATLKRVEAGSGDEEIEEAAFAVQSVEAQLEYETWRLERLQRLHQDGATAFDQLQQARQRVEELQHRRGGLKKHHEAVRRGPLQEEIDVARTDVAVAQRGLDLAKVSYDYRLVRAPTSGVVLSLYRHVGDSVLTDEPTPILRLADAHRLRIRLEVDEADVPKLTPGMEGAFATRGLSGRVGRLMIQRVIPAYGPKRLFNPDSSARVDTRTLLLLCDVTSCSIALYPDQRITAEFERQPAQPPAEAPAASESD